MYVGPFSTDTKHPFVAAGRTMEGTDLLDSTEAFFMCYISG
jgi:hypothetical protein